MVKVTVLFTSYNHADFLKQSIDSILNQTFTDFELIIIDDASTDNSWNIIKKYKDPRIIKIRNKKNKISILNRKLVKSFKGKYFAIAHCDDYWEKTKLEKQYQYLENHKNIAACFTYVNLVDEDNNELPAESYINFNLKNRNRFSWLNHFFYNGNCLCNPSMMMRKKVQLDLNLFAYGLRSLPDFYRWVKLCMHYDIYIYPKKLTNFRIRKGGLNTSGLNLNNVICCSQEKIHIWELYSNLSTNDFFNVFPNSKKYVKNGYFNQKFALARMCIDENKNHNSIYFSLNLIYKLLQNDEDRECLKKYYHYTLRDFICEKQQYDIFSSISKNQIQQSSIYFKDIKDGSYNETEKIKKTVLVDDKGCFELFIDSIDKKVHDFRFDPDEGKIRLYKDISILVNNKKVSFQTNASYCEHNQYFFYHVDPIFFISYKGIIHQIYIKGNTRELTMEELCKYMEEKRNMDKLTIEKEINRKKLHNKIIRKIKKILKK